MKIITKNKKAFHDYVILDRLEAGVVLTGDEVKSLREGKVNLVGSYATIHDGELFLLNAHISPYSHAYYKPEDDASRRTRKLLMHRKEIDKLIGDVARKGVTIVPLALYFKRGKVKVELGVCKHKKSPQRKQELKEKAIKQETRRELKGRYDY